jgi:hypothetical protein
MVNSCRQCNGYVGLCKKQKADLLAGLCMSKFDYYFFAGGAIASLVAFATRNFTTVLALI